MKSLDLGDLFRCLRAPLFVAGALLFFTSVDAVAAKRVALIIGNSSYKNVFKLPNPANDAAAIASLLKSSGFDVVEHKNDLDYGAMRRALRNFTETAQDADIAVVYYAGHGIEVKGTNYLIPTDAALERDVDIEDEAVSLERVIAALEPVKALRLIILDACRDNPFAKSMKRTVASRSIGRGLAEIEPGFSNTLIAFAAKAGSTASDGNEKNSPFTAALLKNIAMPGLDIRLALGNVRDDVVAKTNRKQEPFVYGSLGGGAVSLVPAAPQKAAPVASAAPSLENIVRDYQFARDINTPEAWESFMTAHPSSGYYFNLAKAARDKSAADLKSLRGSDSSRKVADEQAKRKATEEAEMRAAEDTKRKTEVEARRKAESDAKAQAEAEAKRSVEAKVKAEAETKSLADAKLKAEVEAKLKTESETKRKAELEAKVQAEAETRRIAEQKKKADAETTRNGMGSQSNISNPQAGEGLLKATVAGEKSEPSPQQTRPSVVADLPLSASDLAIDPKRNFLTNEIDAVDVTNLLQFHLKRVGCDPGTLDGVWNDKTMRAMALFNASARTNFDVKIASLGALEAVKQQQKRICPLVCSKGYRAEKESCVAISCGRGQVRDHNGDCVRKPKEAAQSVSSQPSDASQTVYCDRTGCRQIPKNCRGVTSSNMTDRTVLQCD